MVDLKSMPPALTLDVLGRACPYPIVLIKKEMEKLPAMRAQILCDSQSTAEEAIPRYCKNRLPFRCDKVRRRGPLGMLQSEGLAPLPSYISHKRDDKPCS